MPLQVKETGGKMALIYDMSVLNEYVHQASFKLEGWEEMFEYAKTATCGVKFDFKKSTMRLILQRSIKNILALCTKWLKVKHILTLFGPLFRMDTLEHRTLHVK
jgi:hypothetical protein